MNSSSRNNGDTTELSERGLNYRLAGVLCLALAFSSCLCAPPKVTTSEIWLGGDVHLGRGGRNVLAELVDPTVGATGIINLEGPVAERATKADGVALFNSEPALSELFDISAQIIGIANNHARDAGNTSEDATIAALTRSKFYPVGGKAGAVTYQLPTVALAVTAHDLTDGVPPKLLDDLTAARSGADLLVATFHVTGPPSYLPRPELKEAVDIALRAGATIVAAHGTHAVAKVEKRGPAVIFWGLGNLVFDCDCTKEKDAIIARILFTEKTMTRIEVIPIEAGLKGRPARPAKDPKAILRLLESLGGMKLIRAEDRGVLDLFTDSSK